VADRYIDVAYVDARIGRSVRESLVGDDAAPDELLLHIEDATADVQGFLRNSGYTCLATQDPTDIEEPVVKRAVMCIVWESLAMKPDSSLAMPENWATMPYRRALDGILSGTMTLNLPQAIGNAPGGVTISTREPRARAEDLETW